MVQIAFCSPLPRKERELREEGECRREWIAQCVGQLTPEPKVGGSRPALVRVTARQSGGKKRHCYKETHPDHQLTLYCPSSASPKLRYTAICWLPSVLPHCCRYAAATALSESTGPSSLVTNSTLHLHRLDYGQIGSSVSNW